MPACTLYMRGNARWDQSHCGQWRRCNNGRVVQRCTLQILCGCYYCGISRRNQREIAHISTEAWVRGAANALAADGWTHGAVKALAAAISAGTRVSAEVYARGAVKALAAAISAGKRISAEVCARGCSKVIVHRNQREIAHIRRGVCARCSKGIIRHNQRRTARIPRWARRRSALSESGGALLVHRGAYLFERALFYA